MVFSFISHYGNWDIGKTKTIDHDIHTESDIAGDTDHCRAFSDWRNSLYRWRFIEIILHCSYQWHFRHLIMGYIPGLKSPGYNMFHSSGIHWHMKPVP